MKTMLSIVTVGVAKRGLALPDIMRYMKLTKYQHACFTVEIDDQVLLVDPGNLTKDLDSLDKLVAVVVTHQHADHCDPDLLGRLAGDGIEIYAHRSVVDSLNGRLAYSVAAGDSVQVGPFRLGFFGGQHATIHSSLPSLTNIGIAINQTVYYPGDSFALPGSEVDVLMLPVAAPWMKIAEAIDYADQLRPRLIIPTHDAILSDSGQAIVDRLISSNLKANQQYQRLEGELTL